MVLAFRAFYVIGPTFAVWAILISVLGFARPDFPGKAMRVVVAISLCLMLAVVLSATIGAKWEHPETRAKQQKAGS